MGFAVCPWHTTKWGNPVVICMSLLLCVFVLVQRRTWYLTRYHHEFYRAKGKKVRNQLFHNINVVHTLLLCFEQALAQEHEHNYVLCCWRIGSAQRHKGDSAAVAGYCQIASPTCARECLWPSLLRRGHGTRGKHHHLPFLCEPERR